MVRIETPFETPARAQTPGGPPPRPPSEIDRVLHIATSAKNPSVNSFPARSIKTLQRPFFGRSANFFDEVISRLIAELSHG